MLKNLKTLNINRAFISRFYSIDIKALPFKITKKQAENIISENVSMFEKTNNTTALQIYNEDPIKIKFIPFHSMEISKLYSSFVGKYGIDRTETYWYYNASTKSMQMGTRTVTDWYRCSGTNGPVTYPLGTYDTQIYAGFNYPKYLVERSLRTTDVENLVNFNKNMLNFDGNTAEIDPHEMKISFALEKMISELYDLEKNRILRHIKKYYRADHSKIENLDMHIDESNIQLFSFYLPAYIYNLSLGNSTYTYKIVSGYSGQLNYHKIWSAPKFFLVGSIIGALLTLHPAFRTMSILARVLLGSSFGIPPALYAKLSPKYKIQHDNDQIKKDYEINKEKIETEDDKKRYEYAQFDSTQRTSQDKSRKLFYPKDKLKLLGLNPDNDVTFQEIKIAYYTQVKKYHPDIYKGNKEFGKQMTQQLNKAYTDLETIYQLS